MRQSYWLLGVVAGMTLTMAAAAFNLGPVAGFVTLRLLAAAGFPDARLEIREFGLTRTVFANADLGVSPPVRAREIIIDYSPGRLAKQMIDGIRLIEPRMTVNVGLAGTSFGPLDRLIGEAASATPKGDGFKIVGPLTIEAGRIEAVTPLGAVDAAIDGSVLMTAGLGTTAAFRFSLDHSKASVSGEAKAILDPDGLLRTDIKIADASSTARVAFKRLSGTAAVAGKVPDGLGGDADLHIQGLAVDGAPFGNLDIVGKLTGGGLTAELTLGGGDTGLSATVRMITENVLDPKARLTIAGQLATDGLLGPLQPPGGVDAVGGLSFEIAGGRDDLARLPGQIGSGRTVTASAPVEGWLDANFIGLSMSSVGFDLTVRGRSEFRIDDGGWRVDPLGEMALEAVSGAHLFAVKLAPNDGAALLQSGAGNVSGMRFGFLFDGLLDGRHRIQGDAGGDLWLGAPGGPRFDNAAVRLRPWRQRLGGLDIGVQALSVLMNGGMDDFVALTTGKATFQGSPAKGVNVDGGQIVVNGRLGYKRGRLTLTPEGCSSANAAHIIAAGIEIRPGPITLCPLADGQPVLDVDFGTAGTQVLKFAVAVPSVEFATKGLGPQPIGGALPRLDGVLSADLGRGTWWGKFAIDGGGVGFDGTDIFLGPATGTLNFEGKDRLLSLGGDLKAMQISDRRRPARLTTLTFAGQAGLKSESLTFEGTLAAAGAPLKVDISARHRLADGRGSVFLRLLETALQPKNFKIEHLAPALKSVVTDVQGSLGGEARLDWAAWRVSSSAKLKFKDIAFGTQLAEAAGVKGEIALSDLLAPRTDGSQTIQIGFLDAGLKLVNGQLSFRLPGDGTVIFDKLQWPFAGGEIGFAGAKAALGKAPELLIGNIRNLKGAALTELAGIDGLEIEGTFTGMAPIRFQDTGARIENAVIEAIGGGVIRYRGDAAVASLTAAGGSGELLAKALANFQYSQLKLTFGGPLGGQMTAKAEIKGANPELYGGKKIELNVDLQGDLRDLLQSASVLRDLPAPIRERIERRAGRP